MRKLQSAAIVVALASGFGCSSKDDGDDSSGDEKDGAIPSDFSNKASSKSEFNATYTTVKTEVVDGAKEGLGFNATGRQILGVPKALLNHFDVAPYRDAAITDDTEDTSGDESTDWTDFTTDLAAGADCGSRFSKLEGFFDTFAGQVAVFDGTFGQLGDDFTATTGLDQIYTVENLTEEGGQYAFHLKLTRKEDASNAQSAPNLDIAGGATDTQIALMLKADTELTFDTTTFETNLNYEFFADAEAKALTIGYGMDIVVTADAKETNVHVAGTAAILGGDLPSVGIDMEFSADAGDEGDNSGAMKFTLAKKSTDSFEMGWDGTFGGESYKQTVLFSRTGATCTVTSVE